jgi:hypothetical protein
MGYRPSRSVTALFAARSKPVTNSGRGWVRTSDLSRVKQRRASRNLRRIACKSRESDRTTTQSKRARWGPARPRLVPRMVPRRSRWNSGPAGSGGRRVGRPAAGLAATPHDSTRRPPGCDPGRVRPECGVFAGSSCCLGARGSADRCSEFARFRESFGTRRAPRGKTPRAGRGLDGSSSGALSSADRARACPPGRPAVERKQGLASHCLAVFRRRRAAPPFTRARSQSQTKE